MAENSIGQHEVEEQAQPPYQWESRPKGTSWVDKLRSSQAKDQCLAWHITPAATLEANRTLLKDFINHKVEKLLGPIHNKSEEIQELEDEARTTPNLKEAPKNIATEDQWSYLVKTTAAAILADMIDSFPLVSGTDPRRLVRFLISFKQVIKLDLVPSNNVILNVLPKTEGQLRALWNRAIVEKYSSSQVLCSVLETFLPGRVRQQCVSEMLYRVQKPKETLADFVTDLQSLADILLAEFGEQDLLDTILTGLNPATRARLAGFPPPTTVDDLYALSPRIDVIRTTEMQFHREYAISSGASGGTPTGYSNRHIQDVHNRFRGQNNSRTAFASKQPNQYQGRHGNMNYNRQYDTGSTLYYAQNSGRNERSFHNRSVDGNQSRNNHGIDHNHENFQGRGQRSFTNSRYRSSNHGSSNQNNIHFTSSNLKAKGGH
ncbi:hypothetical protein J6590_016060 [Homalodisca vitripennis]|nr:hypothetical protein J6590_016060 [Homalodisca vitripennis]